jgi:hypothetical protein
MKTTLSIEFSHGVLTFISENEMGDKNTHKYENANAEQYVAVIKAMNIGMTEEVKLQDLFFCTKEKA